jgi:hypothetical protein
MARSHDEYVDPAIVIMTCPKSGEQWQIGWKSVFVTPTDYLSLVTL